MENKAKIEIVKSGNRDNDKIIITFKFTPDDFTIKELKNRFFHPDDKDLKKWSVTARFLKYGTFIYMIEYLKNAGVIQDNGLGTLGSPYIPASFVCPLLHTITPDSMDYEIHIAVRKVEAEIGDFHEFLMKKLHYTREELCRSLSAEQIDAVVLAIYNIEKKRQGMIIGDQTGIGKGRVAAAMIRYGHFKGLKPVFISEKPNLFSDIYRDLSDIGSADLVPFIVNSRESKTHVKDQDGNVVYEALPKPEQEAILKSQKVPAKYDYVMATYSQFNSPAKKFVKPNFLLAVAQDNIVIMDEAHNASGSSNTGEFLQKVIANTRGVTFLSATFAKRPDNMPIYAMKTAMSETNMTNEQLVEAIKNGGVALQEVLSSQLVAEGQMIRRERSFDGVEVNYITLTEKAPEHAAIADNITEIIRDIIKFQDDYIANKVDELDEVMKADYSEVEERKGTHHIGVDMPPMFSKIFNIINQMLFAIKAESVAERAIMRLKEGKKPVIAFASTMGAFLEQMENENGQPVADGDIITADFQEVLMRALRGVMRYTVTKPNEDTDPDDYENVKNKPKAAYKREYKYFDVSELSPEAQAKYYEIHNKIKQAATGISISPIDIVINKIEEAGYSVAEVTGRKLQIRPINDKPGKGMVETRKKINVNDAFRKFNNNEVDCLMINQSGATGASAHAIVTNKVPAQEVKQRVMIILQAELDINKEVQKRGRINRTGQLFKPIYDYVNSAIPAEQRLMMMLTKKLKSLDANTTSNQKQTSKMLDTDDFLNKYGDKIVARYLFEHKELNEVLGDPLKFNSENKSDSTGNVIVPDGAAHKVSGRVAILSVKEQEKFYSEIKSLYEKEVTYLKQTDQYDLEVETMKLDAETLSKDVTIAGKGGKSSFSKDSYLEKCMVNNLRKPYTKEELENIIRKALDGKEPKEIKDQLIEEHHQFALNNYKTIEAEINKTYDEKKKKITIEKKYQKLPEQERQQYYNQRVDELEEARKKKIEIERTKANNQYKRIHDIFAFFNIGEGYNWPEESFETGEQTVKCVFLGYEINRKNKNPFIPSGVVLKFAVANSIKYITLTVSGTQGEKVQSIIGLSHNLSSYERNKIPEEWEKYTNRFSTDRIVRYIITGNILQAFSEYKGKLVSFTRADGSVEKGILMPSSFDPARKQNATSMVKIPIGKAKKIITGLSQGQSVYSSDKRIGITRGWNSFLFTVPKSKNYKSIYTDPDVIFLTTDQRDGFNMQSGYMKAYIPEENIGTLVDILQAKYNLNVLVSKVFYDQYVDKTESQNEKPELIAKAEQLYEQDKKEYEKIVKKQKTIKKDKVKQESEAKRKQLEKAKAKAKARLKLLMLMKN